MRARAHLIEAVAWWKIGLSGGRTALATAATDALVADLGGDAVAELAGITESMNPFEVDALITRVADELRLHDAFTHGLEALAVRRMCRVLLANEMNERELSGWVHTRFHHESESDLLNLLAELDDEYDEAEYSKHDVERIRKRIRAVAEEILATGSAT